MDVETEPKVAKFTTPGRHKQWIAPLRQMTPRDMPHDLFCFATRYLVEDARTLAVPDATLTQDLPDWLTIEHLLDTGKQVSHGVFVALAERLKEARDDPSPQRLRTAAYHAAGFEDWITNMVRRGGSVKFAVWFTTFMGNLVTKDQQVDARETERGNEMRIGRTIHYFLRPESDMYHEQSTFTRGYYEILTRLWKRTANAPLIKVEEVMSRFSPERLLGDEYVYAARALGIQRVERDNDGNLRVNGEVYAVPVDMNTLQARFNPKYASRNARPVRMTRPVEYAGEVIFREGQILDAPASIYMWEYEKLPPVTRLQVFAQGMKDRFSSISTKHLRASYERVSTERDRANERGEEAERQKAIAERQRGIAEERATEMQQLLYAQDHEVRGEGNVAVNELNRAERRFGEMRKTLDEILASLETGIQTMIDAATSAQLGQQQIAEMANPIIVCYETLDKLMHETTVGNIETRIGLARRRIEYVQSFLKNISFYSRVDIAKLPAQAQADSFFEALEESVKMYNEDNAATAGRIGNRPELITLNLQREYAGQVQVPAEGAQMIMYNLMRNSHELGTKQVDLSVANSGEGVTVHYRDYTGSPIDASLARAYERGEAPPSQGSHLGLGNKIIHRVVSTMGGSLRVVPETDGTSFIIQFKKTNDEGDMYGSS